MGTASGERVVHLPRSDDAADQSGQPRRAAAYVVVAHRGYNEVYPVVGAVPVRIAGDDVDIASSRATFAISQHAADGRRLRDYELEAAVSG